MATPGRVVEDELDRSRTLFVGTCSVEASGCHSYARQLMRAFEARYYVDVVVDLESSEVRLRDNPDEVGPVEHVVISGCSAAQISFVLRKLNENNIIRLEQIKTLNYISPPWGDLSDAMLAATREIVHLNLSRHADIPEIIQSPMTYTSGLAACHQDIGLSPFAVTMGDSGSKQYSKLRGIIALRHYKGLTPECLDKYFRAIAEKWGPFSRSVQCLLIIPDDQEKPDIRAARREKIQEIAARYRVRLISSERVAKPMFHQLIQEVTANEGIVGIDGALTCIETSLLASNFMVLVPHKHNDHFMRKLVDTLPTDELKGAACYLVDDGIYANILGISAHYAPPTTKQRREIRACFKTFLLERQQAFRPVLPRIDAGKSAAPGPG